MTELLTIKPDGKVFLNLDGKEYKPLRMIGNITNGVFTTVRNTSKNQKYNHSNSICLNYKLLTEYRHVINVICVKYDGAFLYSTPRAVVKRGKLINYKQNDLEKQISLSVSSFCNSIPEALKQRNEIEAQDQKPAPVKQEIKSRFVTGDLFSEAV